MFNTERYNRNIIIDSIGEEGQMKLITARVLVAGAGGLGSTALANLASVGIGNIGIIDNDKLELSNLNRQYIHKFENIGKNKVESAKDWINSFNPDINVETYQIRLDETNNKEIISKYDIVIDCFDSYESKFVLNKACLRTNKVLIHGGVAEYFGQLMVVIPYKTACLECLFGDNTVKPYVLKGIISPTVSAVASFQSMEAVKHILGFNKNITNTLLCYNGITQEFQRINVPQNISCPVCGR